MAPRNLFTEPDTNTADPSGLINPATGQVVLYDGLRPGGAPDRTFNMALDYSIPLAGASTVDLRADYRGTDNVFFQTRNRFVVVNGAQIRGTVSIIEACLL